ncbi:MAG TPA: hypothetical protein VI479_10920, partial [Blastocatellia bacterium]
MLIASTLEAFVNSAGAAINVSAANGFSVNGVISMRLQLKLCFASIEALRAAFKEQSIVNCQLPIVYC